MTTASDPASNRLRYHPNAYKFVGDALKSTQVTLGRSQTEDQGGHISGPELLEGIRRLALRQFGLLTRTVFGQWGVVNTDDFGRIVFELIDRGEMRKTDRDQLSDFFDVYDFERVFDLEYEIDTNRAFTE